MNTPVPYTIIYHDQWFLAVAKAAGIAVQGRTAGDDLESLLRDTLQSDLRVVHRIDQPVTGAVIFALTAQAAAAVSRLLADGAVRRTYWALVSGSPEPAAGSLHHRLAKQRGGNRVRVSATGREARLEYRTLVNGDRLSLLEIELETGRHHQIRAQLAAAGFPVRGDLKYGSRRSLPTGGIDLHARSVAFDHPFTGGRLSVEAEPPERSPWPQLMQQLPRI